MTSNHTSTGRATLAEEAAWETTSRLLAALVNEGLVFFTVEDLDDVSSLVLWFHDEQGVYQTRILVSLRQDTKYGLASPAAQITGEAVMPVISPELDPADVVGPVTIEYLNGLKEVCYRPEEVFDVVGPWVCDNQQLLPKLRSDFQNTADNQEKWLQYALSHPPPALDAPLIEWEQRCIRGHPTHPMHRSFIPTPPMKPMQIDDIEELLDAEITIISVPRARIYINGPFEKTLQPLLAKLDFPTVPADRVLLPCFAEQLPAIHAHLDTDDIEVVPSMNKLRVQRQASMRTVSILGFSHNAKMALGCAITSAPRQIFPGEPRMCIEVSQLLQEVMPDQDLLWIARKTAAACSADPDNEKAMHLSVMLREDLEPRARKLGQCLVLPATLFEVGGEDHVAHVVRLFGLKTLGARMAWFRNYTRLYLRAVLPPILSHGIYLEAHMQNMLARFDIETGVLRGFVYRDVSGARMHVPTLSRRGVTLHSARLVPDAPALVYDLDAVRQSAYHDFVANHLGGALRAMGLVWKGGWDVVREELTKALTISTASHHESEAARELLKFMLQPEVKRKAFLKMKLTGVSRTCVYRSRPNPLAA